MNEIVAIENVKIGMYLIDIHESEKNLQVKSQGLIKSTATVASLQKRGVISIKIDVEKSVHATGSHQDSKEASMQHAKASKNILSFEQQQAHLAKADKLYTQARDVQSRFVKQLRSGNAPDIDSLNTVCQDIIDSVFENHQALSCLVMLKDTNDYLVEHSLNCAILLSIFANHLGFSQSDIEDLTISGLLMDIGMTILPQDLVTRTDAYSQADKLLMQTHVDIACEVVDRYCDLPPMVDDVIRNHHERIDGSGYPKQKTDSDISLHAKMAAIVDSYDALISNRGYRSSKSPHDALEQMLASDAFDQGLVASFIEAIGLYPVGSLVHLKSGKLGIVVRHNKPLKPDIMTFYSIRNRHHTEVRLLDLTKSTDKISGAVRPEEFNIDLPKFFKSVLLP
ncbi:HD-GYP domain-containing protein [Glaciecola sp. SC05]|uniref:HD-GYP domain-containing protein n=1 Tax=Glaciecola sp. SC05 TaxID=1987355 RepID=UPI003527FF85